MITENDEYIECMDKLKAINYLIDSTAHATIEDDVKYAKEALIFLSNNMYEALQSLENIILNHSQRNLT
ncbi:MAG TPA: hypothetical protein EYG83_03615 [Sulfurospirillum arcachonense]|nr:hypothetical protein [Sulfurospirillum arcachonense]